MMRKEYDAMKDKVESEVHSPARVQRSLMNQIKKLEDQLGGAAEIPETAQG